MGRHLPLTHAIQAGRALVAGAPWSDVTGPVATEAVIGTVYLMVGLVMLACFERESRRSASLDLA